MLQADVLGGHVGVEEEETRPVQVGQRRTGRQAERDLRSDGSQVPGPYPTKRPVEGTTKQLGI